MARLIFIIFFIISFMASKAHSINQTDLQLAIEDMRSQSYHGFVILLKLLNASSFPFKDVTLFIPGDAEISASSFNDVTDFILHHSIAMPLTFNELAHFPTGSLVPSGIADLLIKIQNRGRANFSINNAKIMAPNVCVKSQIKCHGIDAVIAYNSSLNNNNNNDSNNNGGP
ncbi:FAS1 domain-containing protein SELMODRAFT_448915-like [Impatiens glandulifera]|uniref:FAS1 domain-containing protein SELMODRAFT_448915-like n=1 Tax=Impatiens glandulifera TaxID=253017 RepID=UPI001FB09EFD|nr:FAS1 domain-containing protein SELMODRAFT_448915-like [Impatiens glandulifera]